MIFMCCFMGPIPSKGVKFQPLGLFLVLKGLQFQTLGGFRERHRAKPLVWCKPWSLPIGPQEPTHFRLYALSPQKQRTTDPALLFVPGHGGSAVPRK